MVYRRAKRRKCNDSNKKPQSPGAQLFPYLRAGFTFIALSLLLISKDLLFFFETELNFLQAPPLFHLPFPFSKYPNSYSSQRSLKITKTQPLSPPPKNLSQDHHQLSKPPSYPNPKSPPQKMEQVCRSRIVHTLQNTSAFFGGLRVGSFFRKGFLGKNRWRLGIPMGFGNRCRGG